MYEDRKQMQLDKLAEAIKIWREGRANFGYVLFQWDMAEKYGATREEIAKITLAPIELDIKQ